MLSEVGPATPALAQRLEDLVINVMKNPTASDAAENILAMRKLKGMENKPLVIAGKQIDGKDFTTAGWKGKVVLVDFWATWCPGCVAELPLVKKAYGNFHDKGLEILGISNDYAAVDVTQFLSQNKDMPWPQLFDPTAGAQQQWNPTTLGFGIHLIPQMFLIDKKGILRSVTADENFEDLIPKLIAE
jgi:thiol-disulfide isomerase/thioredoxin